MDGGSEGSFKPIEQAKADTFLSDLTDLCNRHGIGISGDPLIFEMEQEDYPHVYRIDSKSMLYRF